MTGGGWRDALAPWLLIAVGALAVISQLFRFTPSLPLLAGGALVAMTGVCVLADRLERLLVEEQETARTARRGNRGGTER